jgi:hypothetical protein
LEARREEGIGVDAPFHVTCFESHPSVAQVARCIRSGIVAVDRHQPRPGRTFRYAPLSAGLDIVRKVLGQHEGQSRPAAPKCSWGLA